MNEVIQMEKEYEMKNEEENEKEDSEGKELVKWLIDSIINGRGYEEIETKISLESDNTSAEYVWNEIALGLIEWASVQKNIFWAISAFDFASTMYGLAGKEHDVSRIHCLFTLAKIYSDQGGLSRKFKLFEQVIEETKSMIDSGDTNKSVYYYYSRGLNRIANLHNNWGNQEEAEKYYRELIAAAPLGNEEETIQNLISGNARGFYEKNPELKVDYE
jgi:tetratricopeptide (TPR) repeat protein|tara:strand:- start:9 stop:659 length:651 start_codon:yes stop_codon:yes gene_type:complete